MIYLFWFLLGFLLGMGTVITFLSWHLFHE